MVSMASRWAHACGGGGGKIKKETDKKIKRQNGKRKRRKWVGGVQGDREREREKREKWLKVAVFSPYLRCLAPPLGCGPRLDGRRRRRMVVVANVATAGGVFAVAVGHGATYLGPLLAAGVPDGVALPLSGATAALGCAVLLQRRPAKRHVFLRELQRRRFRVGRVHNDALAVIVNDLVRDKAVPKCIPVRAAFIFAV